MTQAQNLDLEAIEREGLIPLHCRNCGRILAVQSKDGNTLHYNQNARSQGTHKPIVLKCECGVSRTWRPERGFKNRNPNLSTT